MAFWTHNLNPPRTNANVNPFLDVGEPGPAASAFDQPPSRNTYDRANPLGQDKLRSFTTYKLDPNTGQFADTETRFTAYRYDGPDGRTR